MNTRELIHLAGNHLGDPNPEMDNWACELLGFLLIQMNLDKSKRRLDNIDEIEFSKWYYEINLNNANRPLVSRN